MPLRRRSIRAIAALVVLVAAAALVVAFVSRREAPPARPASSAAFASVGDADDTVEVWAVGDADDTEGGRAVAERIAADRPDRVLYLGDVYEDGSAEEFRDRFADVFGSLVGKMAPTPGNHEWPAHLEGYDPFWRSVTGRPTPPWYAFSAGAWRIISLNSEEVDDPRQLEWLEREMRSLRERCLLAFWHEPRFSAGYHGDSEDVEPFWRAVRDRAAIVLNGHDHDLQRMRTRDGVVQLVVGAGGHGRRDVDEDDPRLIFATDDEDGALRMELAPDEARLQMVTADGGVPDRATVRCRG